MRVLMLLTFCAALLACNNHVTKEPSLTRLATFLDSFNKANSKYYDFESTEEWGDSLLKVSFVAGCRTGYLLQDFPFVFRDVGRSLEGQPYAHFTGEINDKPGWSIGFDLITPIQYEQVANLQQNAIYRVVNIKAFTPVTQAWIYNVNLKNGVLPYLIRENGNTKIVHLGANYAEATIEKNN